MALQNNSFSFNGFFVGDVLEIERETRRVAVYMPKLMPGIGGDSQISSSVSTASGTGVTGLNFSETVRVRNSVWVKPYDFDEALPSVGSKVIVFFIDGNPKLGYWDKFNPDADYQVIDEDKYPGLLTLRFAGSSVPVNKDDQLTIDFPSDFSSVFTQEGKSKRVEVFKRENYVISAEQPSEPFNGMLWFNTSDESVYLYARGRFSKLITRDDVSDLYSEVERISSFLESTLEFWTSGRLAFLPSFSAIASTIKSPVENQIVVIDPNSDDEAFYKYTSLESEAPLTEDGYYFLEYANLVIERSLEIERQLRAYKYNGSEWEEMDGWFSFEQPAGSLGDFQISTNQTVNTTDTYEWNFRTSPSNPDLYLKVTSLKFEGISISSNTEVTMQFYSNGTISGNTTNGSFTVSSIASTADLRVGDSVSGSGIPSGATVISIPSSTSITISASATATATGVTVTWRRNMGSEFTLVNTSGTLSIEPAVYNSLYLSGSNLFVPDISRFGVEVSNIKCDAESDVSTTLNFGTAIILEARSSEEV